MLLIQEYKSVSNKIGGYMLMQFLNNVEMNSVKYVNIFKSNDTPLRLLQLEYYEAAKNCQSILHQITNLRITDFTSLSDQNKLSTFEKFIKFLNQIQFGGKILASRFNLEHWEVQKKRTYLSLHPDSPTTETSDQNFTVKLQQRLIKADQFGTPVVQQYISHQLSVEGQALRQYATAIQNVKLIADFRKIPGFIEKQRISLVKRIKSLGNKKDDKSNEHLSPQDQLRHSQEGISSILTALYQAKNSLTPEAIEYEMEQYFYSLAGPYIFSHILNKENDDIIAENCLCFESATPSQFNIPKELAKSGNSLFLNAISLFKDIPGRSSPTSKLIAVYKAVEDLLNETNKKTGIKMGVDDLTDPLLYCILKANIEKAFSQVIFIENLTKPKFMQSAFGAHFATLRLVIQYVTDIVITDETVFAIKTQKTLSNIVSLQKPQKPSSFDYEHDFVSPLHLSIDAPNRKPPGCLQVGDPIEVKGYKAAAFPLWHISPSVTKYVIVKTDEDCSVIMYPLIMSEDNIGSRTISNLVKGKIPQNQIATKDGIIAYVNQESIPESIANLMIYSYGDVLSQEKDIELKVQLSLLDGKQCDIEEHIRNCQTMYGIDECDPNLIISLITRKISESLTKLGLMSQPTERIDPTLLAALSKFNELLMGQNEEILMVTPTLVEEVCSTENAWREALTSECFGFNTNKDLRVSVAFIQFYNGMTATGILDPRTIGVGRRLALMIVNSPETPEGDKVLFRKLLL